MDLEKNFSYSTPGMENRLKPNLTPWSGMHTVNSTPGMELEWIRDFGVDLSIRPKTGYKKL